MAASAPPRWRACCKTSKASWPRGIVMVSPMLEGHFQFGGDRFALGAALELPSLAAAELERKGTFSTAAWRRPSILRSPTILLHCRAAAARRGRQAFYARVAQSPDCRRMSSPTSAASSTTLMSRTLRRDHKIVSRYDVTFATDDPNPEIAVAARPRSDSRWRGAGVRQCIRRLCARRARVQDRYDLQFARV